jgi:hypothetical protein
MVSDAVTNFRAFAFLFASAACRVVDLLALKTLLQKHFCNTLGTRHYNSLDCGVSDYLADTLRSTAT